MNSIYNIKPSKELDRLINSSQLSNQVSIIALKSAKEVWLSYIQTSNRKRNADDVLYVADKLRLVINQVANRRTRINPLMWHKLLNLEVALRIAFERGINLEPRLSTVAANDDSKGAA